MNIPTRSVPGVDVPVSRLVMGTQSPDNAPALFDDFLARGGNAFDTAYIYGGGSYEKSLGAWVKARGLRRQVAILVKGAHSPNCHPKALDAQFVESLDRLGTDYADFYALHRDNLEVPVGEFVDVLNRHAAAGRVKVFGGSNWTLARIDEANTYAKAKGLKGFGLVSNNLSLARMVEAPWGGCLGAHDADSLAWFHRTQTPLFSWSSQGRGFFVRADPEKRDDKDLVRCWYADDNFERLKRARELAAKKNSSAINIALAWVLAQTFPTFALIGPANAGETESCTRALDLTLTPDDVRWLDLG